MSIYCYRRFPELFSEAMGKKLPVGLGGFVLGLGWVWVGLGWVWVGLTGYANRIEAKKGAK